MAYPQTNKSKRTQKSSLHWYNYQIQKANFLPVLLFVVGVIFSGVAARWLYNEIELSAKAEFQRNVERISGEIVKRFINRYTV